MDGYNLQRKHTGPPHIFSILFNAHKFMHVKLLAVET